MSVDGVLGSGIGMDGSGNPIIRVYTLRPGPVGLPARLEGIPVEAVATGMIVAGDVNDPTTGERPAPNGFSIGHPDITAGTLGTIVKNAAGDRFILSNNHVLANSNDASIGDASLQPGPFDGGTSADQIGTLANFVPMNFSGGNNTVDAAISSVNGNDVTAVTPGWAYGAPGTSTTSAFVGQGVQKFGRTTSHTTGVVAETNVTVDVCYETRGPFRCVKLARFVNQFTVSDGSFSAGGDSGSLIVTNNAAKDAVGLLFAGSSTRTIANPIAAVLTAFGVTITTDPGGTGDDPPSVSVTSPSDGATVSGSVPITADASDDNAVTQVEFFVDGGSVGTDTDGSDGWSASWDASGETDGSLHTITAEATDDALQTTLSAAVSVTVDNSPPATMHVGDLSSVSVNQGSTWNGVVTITIVDSGGNPVAGASVSGSWSGSGSGSGNCSVATDGSGQCTVTRTGIAKRNGSVTYTVTGVTHADLTYDETANAETSIVVNKP